MTLLQIHNLSVDFQTAGGLSGRSTVLISAVIAAKSCQLSVNPGLVNPSPCWR